MALFMSRRDLLTVTAVDSYTISTSHNVSVLSNSSAGLIMNQSMAWANSVDGTSVETAIATSTDTSGNTYLCGHYNTVVKAYNSSWTAVFDLRTPAGSSAAFIVKINPQGTPLWWSCVDGTDTETAKACDVYQANGSVYFTATYKGGNCAIYDSSGTSLTILPSSLSWSGVLVKYDSCGNLLWRACAYGDGPANYNNAYTYGVSVTSSDEVYVLNYNSIGSNTTVIMRYYTSSDIAACAIPVPPIAWSTFMTWAKYSSSGSLLWAAKTFQTISPGSTATYGNCVSCSDGSLYIGGHVLNTCGNVLLYSSSGATTQFSKRGNGAWNSLFIAKYSASGTHLWNAVIDASVNPTLLYAGVTVDALNNPVITGTWSANTSLYLHDSSGNHAFTINACTRQGVFAAKYDSSSGAPLWARMLIDCSYSNTLTVTRPALNANNDLFIAGGYAGTSNIIYDATGQIVGRFINTSTATDTGAYLLKYSSSGIYKWNVTCDSSQVQRGDFVAVQQISSTVTSISYATTYNGKDNTVTMRNGSGTVIGLLRNSSGSTSAGVVKIIDEERFQVPSYSLTSSLGPSHYGFSKLLLNNSPYDVTIANINGSAVVIPTGILKEYIWLHSSWMACS